MSENEKKKILSEHEISPDEMKTLGGGTVIDWPADCKATVENGSSCWATDACIEINVSYSRDKSKYGCSSTVSSLNLCWSSDRCVRDEIIYAVFSSDFTNGGYLG